MADISQEELVRRLRGASSAPTGVEPTAPVTERPLPAPASRQTPTGELIPLDQASGVPFLTRLNIATLPDPASKQAALQKAFSAARVEPLPGKLDEFVIRDYQDPQTGQVKDLLVDERAATFKDIADLGEVGVELIGAYAALRGGRSLTSQIAPGLARTLSEAAVASTGAQLAGAVSDAAGRFRTSQPIQPLEIAQRRSVGAMTDTALDLGFSIPVLAAARLANIRRGVPQTQEAANAVAARNRLFEETGVTVPFSLGQQTGSERLLQSEEFIENASFGGGPQRQARIAQDKAVESLQSAVIESFGDVPAHALPSKDVIGNRAVAALRSIARGAEAGTVQARTSAMTEAMQDLSSAINSSTSLASIQILTREAGQVAQTFIGIKKEAFDEIASQLKQAVDEASGTEAFIPSEIARRNLKPIVEKLTRPESGKLFEAIPPKVKAFISDIEALPRKRNLSELPDFPEDIGVGPASFTLPSKGLITLNELRNIRTMVNEAIGDPILGTAETGVLKQISKSLTQTLDEGITHAPNADAQAALKKFNAFYRENIEGFQVKGITEILADPTQRKLGPIEIFDQAARSPDQYFRLKEVLTKPLILEGTPVGPVQAGEATWATFKQAMWQELTDQSRKTGNRALLDPKSLLNKLSGMKPEVVSDLLGFQADVALRSLKRLEVLDNPKLPAEEALEILRQGGDTAPARIQALADRERELDQLYSNQVIKKFVKGEIGAESIKPADFIDRFADSGSISDVRDALNRLELQAPGTVNLIRQKKVQSLFETAQANPLADEVAAKKLAKEIRSPEVQERLQAILGAPGTQRLNDFTEMLAHLQRPGDKAAKMGGSMAGGSQKGKLLTLTGLVAALPKQAQYWFTGMLLSNPRVARMATAPVQPLDPTKLLRAIIVSDDAITSMAGEFGSEAFGMLQRFLNVPERSQDGDISQEELRRRIRQLKQ